MPFETKEELIVAALYDEVSAIEPPMQRTGKVAVHDECAVAKLPGHAATFFAVAQSRVAQAARAVGPSARAIPRRRRIAGGHE